MKDYSYQLSHYFGAIFLTVTASFAIFIMQLMKLDWLSPVCSRNPSLILAFLGAARMLEIMGMTDYNDISMSALQGTLIQQNVNRHFSLLG